MIVVAGDWIKSEYITIDESGWHCSDDAPDDIKQKFEDYMSQVNGSVTISEPELPHGSI